MSEQQTSSLLAGTISPAHADARAAHWAKVRALADTNRQGLVLRLLDTWEEANSSYYGGAMLWPYILLAEPMAPNVYGSCGPVTAWGEQGSQIRIRPSLLAGTHPDTRRGNGDTEGLYRLAADVLLHEQIHQWQQEVTGNREESYHGHGPDFCRKANEIGAALGLAPVIPRNRASKEHQSLGANWPHNIRLTSYYLGAFVPTSRDNSGQASVRARRTAGGMRVDLDMASWVDLLAGLTLAIEASDPVQAARLRVLRNALGGAVGVHPGRT